MSWVKSVQVLTRETFWADKNQYIAESWVKSVQVLSLRETLWADKNQHSTISVDESWVNSVRGVFATRSRMSRIFGSRVTGSCDKADSEIRRLIQENSKPL